MNKEVVKKGWGMKVKLALFLVIFSVLFSVSLHADDSIENLQSEIQALQERVAELEAKQTREKTSVRGSGNSFFRDRRGLDFDPLDEMKRMQDEIDKVFQDSFGSFGGMPKNMTMKNKMALGSIEFVLNEKDDEYEIVIDMKGLNKEKIDVEINKHSVTVKGEYSSEATEEGPGTYYKSQAYGSFMKTIPLPVDADTSKIETKKEGDNLVIQISKKID